MGKKPKLEPLSESSDTSDLSDNDEEIEESGKHEIVTSANNKPTDFAESDTESDDEDDDEENDEDDDEENDEEDEKAVKSKEPASKYKIENIKAKILSKYASTKGKQLFIRFPEKLPLDVAEFQKRVRSLTPLIVNAHKPRQRHARFCTVDFATQDDRDVFFTHISKSSKKKDAKYAGIVAALPRTESENFIEDLVQKKLQSIENKKAKMRLRKAAKIAERTKNFTSTIVILNLPQTATNADVRKLFPNAIDIQLRPPKGRYHGPNVAAITFPTTMDARTAVKRKLQMENTKLIVKFALEHTKKKNKNKEKKKQNKSKKGKEVAENAMVTDGQMTLVPKQQKVQLQKPKSEDEKLQTITKENPKKQKQNQQLQPKKKITKILGLENGDLVKQIKKTQLKKNIQNTNTNKQNNNQEPPKQQQRKPPNVLGLHKKSENKKLKQKVKKLKEI